MRTLKELYQLLLDNHRSYINGICSNIDHLWNKDLISDEEYNVLSDDFKRRKPNIFSKFYWNEYYTGGVYWWANHSLGDEQRKLFLQHIIKKLK